jgi:hypothetical protein
VRERDLLEGEDRDERTIVNGVSDTVSYKNTLEVDGVVGGLDDHLRECGDIGTSVRLSCNPEIVV